jgi:hypothetical protein
MAPARQRKPLEADHGVPTPVSEPGVTGDDTADFIASGAGPSCISYTSGGGDNELVGSQH